MQKIWKKYYKFLDFVVRLVKIRLMLSKYRKSWAGKVKSEMGRATKQNEAEGG